MHVYNKSYRENFLTEAKPVLISLVSPKNERDGRLVTISEPANA